jgi:hypothetical protein
VSTHALVPPPADVVKLAGGADSAGDTARVPPESVELTRKEYVVPGVSPERVTTWDVTGPSVPAERVSASGEVP